MNFNDLEQFEVLGIAYEVQLRLHFHYDLFDVVQFDVLEIAFEVQLRLQFHLFFI